MGVDLEGLVLSATGELAVVIHKGLDGVVEGQVDGLENGQHLVACLDELTGEEFAHMRHLTRYACGRRICRAPLVSTHYPKRPVM